MPRALPDVEEFHVEDEGRIVGSQEVKQYCEEQGYLNLFERIGAAKAHVTWDVYPSRTRPAVLTLRAERIGRTRRNESMFGNPGIAYVYRIYGIHWCLNVVTDELHFPAAVLIRALEPVHGLEHMRARRYAGQKQLPATALCSGPGRLAEALGITGQLDGHPLDRAPLWLRAAQALAPGHVSAGPRVGITRAADWPLRFWETGNRWVSR